VIPGRSGSRDTARTFAHERISDSRRSGEFEEGAEPALNELGADGWEVTGFARFKIGRENGYRVILKRSY
jgi:hypothetical protein